MLKGSYLVKLDMCFSKRNEDYVLACLLDIHILQDTFKYLSQAWGCSAVVGSCLTCMRHWVQVTVLQKERLISSLYDLLNILVSVNGNLYVINNIHSISTLKYC